MPQECGHAPRLLHCRGAWLGWRVGTRRAGWLVRGGRCLAPGILQAACAASREEAKAERETRGKEHGKLSEWWALGER